MIVISVVSMKGGVGKTSVTANLAAGLVRKLGCGLVGVLDLDPQNSLSFHFGLGGAGKRGVSQQSLLCADWREVVCSSEFGVDCLPYGDASELEREAFESLLAGQSDWVESQLIRAGFDQKRMVLIDTPPGSSVYLQQAFNCADVVLIVVLADAGSYVTIPAMESWINENPVQHPALLTAYVLNQIDATNTLSLDVMEVLRQQMGARVMAGGIHRDEAVAEALAFQQPVTNYDPHSQASNDIRRIVEQLMMTVSR